MNAETVNSEFRVRGRSHSPPGLALLEGLATVKAHGRSSGIRSDAELHGRRLRAVNNGALSIGSCRLDHRSAPFLLPAVKPLPGFTTYVRMARAAGNLLSYAVRRWLDPGQAGSRRFSFGSLPWPHLLVTP